MGVIEETTTYVNTLLLKVNHGCYYYILKQHHRQIEYDVFARHTPPKKNAIYFVTKDDLHVVYNEMHLQNLY